MGWPHRPDTGPPVLVLFEDIEPPASAPASPPTLQRWEDLDLEYVLHDLGERPISAEKVTLIGAKKTCEAKVQGERVVRLTSSKPYAEDLPPSVHTRVARQIYAPDCEGSWYFGVLGQDVKLQPISQRIAAPPEVAAALPGGAPAQLPAVQIGRDWIVWETDDKLSVVRDGRTREVEPPFADAVAVIWVDGAPLLFGATPWPSPEHFVAPLEAEPIRAIAWAKADREMVKRAEAHNAALMKKISEIGHDISWHRLRRDALLAGTAGGVSSVLGALLGAVVGRISGGRPLRGALCGLAGGPLALYSIATVLLWGGLAAFLMLMSGLSPRGPDPNELGVLILSVALATIGALVTVLAALSAQVARAWPVALGSTAVALLLTGIYHTGWAMLESQQGPGGIVGTLGYSLGEWTFLVPAVLGPLVALALVWQGAVVGLARLRENTSGA